MSYRVDIPTLSANEVYTLTFEYEGTETIQLIVGDLTLETTDRRVVFTTTSPVNYIESNVNLINLNMYEGYYESDDFGGEYTQESYIEGKSLVNLYDPNIHYKQNNTAALSFGNSSYFQKTITEDGFINCKILNADAINSSGSAWQQLRTYSTMSQGNTDVFTVILFLRKNNVKTTGLTVKFGYGHASYDVTEIVKGDIDPSSGSIYIPTGQIGIYHAVVKRGGHSSRVSLDYYTNSMEIGFSGDWKNGELEYSWVVLEGDHHDEFVNGEINYFIGIGCVKSPKIVSIGNTQGFGKGGRL